jgi:hypothetical protein
MYLESRNVVKFGVLVGFTAIFLAASIAHGLLWENDLYWTYWITQTFLITIIRRDGAEPAAGRRFAGR